MGNGQHRDVTFVVEDEEIKAHSLMLSAHSEVFNRELSCGMRESTLKRIVVNDCDPIIFKALLKFFYTDDFSHIEDGLKDMASTSGEGSGASSCSARISL